MLFSSAFFLLYIYRAAKDLEERRSHYEPSIGPGVPDYIDDPSFNFEENDFVPHFQRVSISGEDTSGVSLKKNILLEKLFCLHYPKLIYRIRDTHYMSPLRLNLVKKPCVCIVIQETFVKHKSLPIMLLCFFFPANWATKKTIFRRISFD